MSDLIMYSKEWFEDDMAEYNKAVILLPTLTTSNCSPEVMQHIAFQGGEIVRLRQDIRNIAMKLGVDHD